MGATRRAALLLAATSVLGVAACSGDGDPSDPNSQVVTASAPKTTPAKTATATQGGGSVPVSLKIPSINLDQKVTGMGLSSAGTISPPPGVTQWYNATVTPGKPGISVIAGHVTWNSTPDVFAKLEDVKVGDKIVVGYADGTSKTFKANREKSVNKTDLQKDQSVWGSSATPVLALITCDAKSPVKGVHHTNNFVVWAAPE